MPWKPRFLFDRRYGKELLHFGKHLVIASLIGMVNKQIDNLIVGKLLGLTALGYYTMAYRWGGIFAMDIGSIVNQVIFPLNVKYQHDFPMLEKIQAQSMKYASLMMFPISFGFLITCPEFVNVVLGQKWSPSIIPLQILSIYSLFWAIAKRGNLFEAIGKPQYILFLEGLFALILIVLIFPFTYRMGIIGTALAVTVDIFIVIFIVSWWLLAKICNFNIKYILSMLIIPFISSLLMIIIIYGLKKLLYSFEFSQLAVLILSIITGILAYIFCLFLLMKKELKQIASLLFTTDIPIKEKFMTFIDVL